MRIPRTTAFLLFFASSDLSSPPSPPPSLSTAPLLGEFVRLIREPRNPYDANAVRVDNMSGQQVCKAQQIFESMRRC